MFRACLGSVVFRDCGHLWVSRIPHIICLRVQKRSFHTRLDSLYNFTSKQNRKLNICSELGKGGGRYLNLFI